MCFIQTKVTEPFLRLALPLLKVDSDGQVGIWKAPLPLGTAELKRHIIQVVSRRGALIKQRAPRGLSSIYAGMQLRTTWLGIHFLLLKCRFIGSNYDANACLMSVRRVTVRHGSIPFCQFQFQFHPIPFGQFQFQFHVKFINSNSNSK